MYNWLTQVPTDGLLFLNDIIVEFPDSLLRFHLFLTDNKNRVVRCNPVAQCLRLENPDPIDLENAVLRVGGVEFSYVWGSGRIGIKELYEKVKWELDRRAGNEAHYTDSFWNALTCEEAVV